MDLTKIRNMSDQYHISDKFLKFVKNYLKLYKYIVH